jgi:glycerol-3-phosphate dehydrogenase
MEQFDIVIIGGGIHGVGAAQAAAAAGYHVCVLEQADQLAQGTSSRSSKLIHGGLRYLETGQLSLVRECLHERAILLRIAPDLVKLQPFHIPVFQQTRRRPWQLHLGLGLYALLSGLDKAGHFQRLAHSQWQNLDGLNTQGLQAVFRYYDAQTDDALLTRAVMDSAIKLGAELQLSATVNNIQLGQPNQISFMQHGHEHHYQANIVINAAGPWVNKVLDHVKPAPPRQAIEWVQGTHIELDGQLQQGFYYLESPLDQRAVFAMPWQGHILVGTTETRYQGDPALVQPLEEEQDYLLQTLGHYFPAFNQLTRQDIRHSFAGLRVLPAGSGKASKRPRETILLLDRPEQPRLLTDYGGKLTAYRATAEKIIKKVAPFLPQRKRVADTQQLRLGG